MMAIIGRSHLSGWRFLLGVTGVCIQPFLIGQLVPLPGDSFTFESIRTIPFSVPEID